MRLLDVNVDIGPDSTPAELESVLRGIRVAVDVAHGAELRRIRRTATEQMKYPTDAELADAEEQLGQGDEQSPRYRARMQIEARKLLRRELRRMPPDLWFERLYRQPGKFVDKEQYTLHAAGFERSAQAIHGPFPGGTTVGLDVSDPVLYHALVAESLARLTPSAVGVRELRYSNPMFSRLFGKGAAEKTISTTVQVIETISTIGATRKMAQADAAVAQQTVDHRVEDSILDVELKRLAVKREQQAFIRDQIENAQAFDRLNAERTQRSMVLSAVRIGQLDIADSIEALEPGDARALGGLGFRQVELDEHFEDDEPDA